MAEDKIYTVKALAEVLGLSEDTIRRKASAGEIPSYKQFGRYYFLHSEIVDLLRQGERKNKK
ncbi:MAG: helix-turn-helix domain-containing protein [Bacteroidota bacterium]